MYILDKHLNPYNASFEAHRWFAHYWSIIPNEKKFTIKDANVDLNKLCQILKEKYPDFEISSLIDDYFDCEENYIEAPFGVLIMVNIDLKLVIRIYRYSVKFYYIEYTEEINEIVEFIKDNMFKLNCKKERNSKINFITFNGSSYDIVERNISNKYTVDIDTQYNDNFKLIHNQIVEFINNTESGLVILHGKPGTGKTTYIRHLINITDKKYIVLNNALMDNLSNPSFTSFLIDQKDSVLILEDCERLLVDRSENVFNDGINNILNISDGLYSDILNIKIIATFNADITTIDKALLRKGRLAAKYSFDVLSLDKTNNLLASLNKDKSDKGLTLAEIYNYDSLDYSEKKIVRKLGF